MQLERKPGAVDEDDAEAAAANGVTVPINVPAGGRMHASGMHPSNRADTRNGTAFSASTPRRGRGGRSLRRTRGQRSQRNRGFVAHSLPHCSACRADAHEPPLPNNAPVLPTSRSVRAGEAPRVVALLFRHMTGKPIFRPGDFLSATDYKVGLLGWTRHCAAVYRCPPPRPRHYGILGLRSTPYSASAPRSSRTTGCCTRWIGRFFSSTSRRRTCATPTSAPWSCRSVSAA